MAAVSALPAPRSRPASLSLAALGIGLVVLVGITWGTGLLYVTSRAGLPSPVRLALIDGVHIYVGVAAAAFFALKVWSVGFKRKVAAAPSLTLWQRWVSLSLVILYPSVFLTGFAAILPLGASWREALVQAHLMTSVWSLVPTTLHVLHHRRRAVARLSRTRPGRSRSVLWAGIALAALPAVFWLPFPRAVAPATQALAGGAWQPAGLQGVLLDRIGSTPDGAHLVAAGDGVYVGDSAGRRWHPLDLLGPSGADSHGAPGAQTAAPGGHSEHLVPAGAISALTLPSGPVAIYAGSSTGLFTTTDATAPLTQDHFPGGEVRAVAVDPRNPYERWVATGSGIWFAWVLGHGWTNESSGLREPNGAYAIAFYRDVPYASDLSGVYRWDAAGGTWTRVLDELGVVSLTANANYLVATSFSLGVSVYDGASWRRAGSGLPGHSHGAGHAAHVAEVVAPPSGGLFAVVPGGVAFSSDGARSWSSLGSGLPQGTWDVARIGDRLVAATSDGVYEYNLGSAPPVTPRWLIALIAVALAAGAAGAATTQGRFRPRRRTPAQGPPRR
ncbi:hypothetical protein EPN29_11110 [bacterium]|nr:MAG: hypothetical protein EPN29_11110 [bacterium]